MVLMLEHKAAYIYLTKEDYTQFGISRGDTEGIVNYLLMMKDVWVAALITEQPTIIKNLLEIQRPYQCSAIGCSSF